MMSEFFQIIPGEKISGDIFVPGDKSISHRAVILSSIAEGVSIISNLSLGLDVLNTIEAMRALGVEIYLKNTTCEIQGVGLHGLKSSKKPIDCGNSGTAMRLLCGLLSAQTFSSVLIGDDSLQQRPMLRVAEPLRLMGAKINLSLKNTAPIEIVGSWELGVGGKLKGIVYEMPVASAQVKSAILLAGLYAEGETIVHEKIQTRDHTERMTASHQRRDKLRLYEIPGDISAAAFFIVLASITKDSDLIIRQVGINPFRTGILDILKLMGANIELFNHDFFGLEPVADIRIRYAPLHGISIPQALIANAIDEFPAIFIAAVCASGHTILRGARELRVKESDRISGMSKGFAQLGIKTKEYDDGILIMGDQVFQGGRVDSFGDHRIAMAFAIAGHVAKGEIFVDNCAFVKTSFLNFVELANQLGMQVQLLTPLEGNAAVARFFTIN